MRQRRTFVGIRLALVAVAAGSLFSSACGYALAGRGSFLPDYIRVIGIPQFEMKQAIFDLDRVLTEAVRIEFANRGRYTIQPDVTNVDAVLTGTITDVRFNATAFTANSQASRMQLIVTASFEFKDLRTNKVLWSNTAATYREDFDVATAASADAASFLGQDRNAMRKLAQSYARSVVSSILEAF